LDSLSAPEALCDFQQTFQLPTSHLVSSPTVPLQLYLPNNINPYDHRYFPGGEFDTHNDIYEPETAQPVPFAHNDG
jgi:hypothetical protein